MSMFGGKPGGWSFRSKEDSRWNFEGRAEAMIVTAGMCQEARDKLKELEERLGESPDDLTYSCMKD